MKTNPRQRWAALRAYMPNEEQYSSDVKAWANHEAGSFPFIERIAVAIAECERKRVAELAERVGAVLSFGFPQGYDTTETELLAAVRHAIGERDKWINEAEGRLRAFTALTSALEHLAMQPGVSLRDDALFPENILGAARGTGWEPPRTRA